MVPKPDYYDLIAPEYNSLLERDPTNALVRTKVEQYFRSQVPKGRVMDFGGGTGLDLPWLMEISERIIFCEPSIKMRQIAMNHIEHHPARDGVLFLDDESSNVLNWAPGVPTSEPLDACLANFAVLNNIRNLDLIFDKLSSIVKAGGDLIVNILDANLKTLITRYPTEYLRSLFTSEILTYTLYHETKQDVFLHPIGKIKRSANPFFETKCVMPLKGYGFTLVHLKRR